MVRMPGEVLAWEYRNKIFIRKIKGLDYLWKEIADFERADFILEGKGSKIEYLIFKDNN